MLRIVLGSAIALLGAALVATDVEAKRLGGGRSVGVQKNVAQARPATPPRQAQQAAPAQQQVAAQNASAAQPAAAANSGSRWLPLLGGLAAGGLLASLFGGSGLAAVIAIALLAALVALLVFGFARHRAAAARPMQYAGAGPTPYGAFGSETVVAPPPSQAAGLETREAESGALSVPAGFDAKGFMRAAKLNFIRLQVANDQGDLEEIRDVTTPEMFEELRKPIVERTGGAQQTDVVSLNADLLEVAAEGDQYRASVRFSGMVWEVAGSAPVGFEEIWHLVKPVDGSSGWLLAGIQQPH